MPTPYKLKEVEDQFGPLEDVIPQLVNTLGSQRLAADELGISETTVCLWLKNNGYEKVTIYRKREEKTA